jgi:AAA domain
MQHSHIVYPPAEGERRAIGGYYPQYRIAASLILRSLREESLQWIRIADREAGHVDDFQIGSQSRVDAFQVKWSQSPGTFTFGELTRESGNAPALIAQLAEGWKRLRAAYPSCRIVVHLVTNNIPSVSSSQHMPIGEPPPAPRHFAAFIEQVWKPAQKASPNSDWSIPRVWRSTWEAMQAASGLCVTDFEAFVPDCELEFGYHLPGPETGTTRDQQITQADLDHLTQTLFGTVASPERIIELTREQLLARLGWKARLEYRNRHEFPVDEALYQPIEATVHQLHAALDSLPGGYIAVLGTPGSGKSTLLTQTLRGRPEHVIRYYAYVPDAQDPILLRGESENFLHDVTLALERTGCRVGASPSAFDRAQLLQRFYQQLQHLHEDWQATGRKTVILIDGLDHIAREQHPQHSFLHDLPLPNQVPEGVYIVLGSQTDQLAELPDRVQHNIRQPGRRIQMQSLPREAVLRVVERLNFSVSISPEQMERIFALSEGHPLALAYLVKRLQGLADPKAIDTVLDTTQPYEGDIVEQYHSYWRQIEAQDQELAHLFGLLARLRRVIDLEWVETWAGRAVVERLRRSAYYYFKPEDHHRWYFFHNSFRLFLIQHSAESSPGVPDSSRDRAFHRELAGICAQALETSYWSWEELYHRIAAEEHEVVLQKAHPEWFRNQFLAFRPLDAVQTDIRLALRSAKVCQDPVALSRLILAGAEMALRAFHLERTASIIPLLLSLDEKQIAVEYIRDGNRLRISSKAALRISLDLKNMGLDEEAKRVFELAEPLDLLAAGVPIERDPQDEKGTLLEAWIEAAVYFRSVDKVIETIRKTYRKADPFERIDDEIATRSLQNRLLFHAGLALLIEQRWEELSEVAKSFNIDHIEDLQWWFCLKVHAWRDRAAAGDKTQATHFLEKTLNVSVSALTPEELLAATEGVYRLLQDAEGARALLQYVPQPNLQTDILRSDTGLHPFLQRFRLNRLLYVLGDQRPPTEIVSDSSMPQEQGLVYFERALCVVAHIWAEAWRGRKLDGATIKHEIFPLLRLFNRSWQETQDWTNWHSVQSVRGEFYELLVDTVAQHGSEATNALRIAFEWEWDSIATGVHWPTDVRRKTILALQNVGVSRGWAIERLRALEERMLEGLDASGRVDECRKQAEAWLSLEDHTSARQLLYQILRVSFGLAYQKDDRPSTWVEWLGRINVQEPERTAERIIWFARATVALEDVVPGRSSRDMANALLRVTFRWSPQRAISLFQWFLNQRVVQHEEAVALLLEETLKSPESPTTLVLFSLIDFLLPIATQADPELAALLIEKAAARHGTQRAIEIVCYFCSKVQLYALPSTRPKWRRGIARALQKIGIDLQRAGLTPTDLEPDQEENGSSSSLKLKDASTLSVEEIQEHVSSIEELQKLLNNQSDDSYFDWEPIVAHIAEKVGLEDIHTLAGLFQSNRDSVEILTILSKRLCALSDTKGGWSLGEQALNASRVYGWIRRYDGGSRLAACQALVHADPLRARPFVYDRLVRDLTGEFWEPENLALALDKILPLLTDQIPIQAIWPAVEQYVHTLFEGCSFPTDSPDLDKPPSHDSPSWAIADLLILHIDHPVYAVAQASKRACVKLLLQRDPTIQDAVHEILEKTESQQEHLLLVLDAVSLHDPDVLAPFRNKIQSLYQSPNYAIRRAAQIIGKRIGCEQTDAQPSPIPLSAIYQLSFPQHNPRELIDPEAISYEEPLPDSDDPLEIIHPFDLQIGLVAEKARLPKVNLYHRTVQIMQQLAPISSWSEDGERRLRAVLDSAELGFTFHRPRPFLARRAMCHIIAELIDAHVLEPNDLFHLDSVLRFYDPYMFLTEPTQRPASVPPMAGKRRFGGMNEEWLEQIVEAVDSACCKTADGLTILAEETTLKWLEREVPTEVRRSVVGRFTVPHSKDPNLFFSETANHLVTEYPFLCADPATPPLIFRHTAYVYDSPGQNWLALNPTIGSHLGWSLADDGLFRWINNAGQTMVESIWWIDGLDRQSSPHFHDEVGEGWLVVASPAAWDAIQSQLGPLRRLVYVERSFSSKGKRLQRDMHSEQVIHL